MAGGHHNRDDPDLPKLTRFRLGPDGSTMMPIPEPRPAQRHDAVLQADDDTTILNFDVVSDDFDESDLTESLRQFPATASLPGTGAGPAPQPSGPIPPPQSAATPSGPAGAYSARGTAPTQDQPSNAAVPDAPGGAGKRRALWAAGAAAVVVLVAAFVLIAKPFSDAAPAPQDKGKASDSSSRPADRDSGSAESSTPPPNGATPERLPPNSGGVPGSPRPADPSKWATNICGAITSYQQASEGLSQDIAGLGTSPVAKAKLVTIVQQGGTLLTNLRADLASITEGGDNGKLTKVQTAVATAADDAAVSIDPASSDNKGQSVAIFGDKVKEELARPTSTLKSEVAKLDTALQKTISGAKACEPLDL